MRSARSSVAGAWVRSRVDDRAWPVLGEFSRVGDLLLRRPNLSLLSFPCFTKDMLGSNLNWRRSFVLDVCQSWKLHLRREREPIQGEERGSRRVREKRKEKMKREEREREYKIINFLQHLSVLL